MDNRLADVQNRRFVLGQDVRQTGCQTRFVLAGDIDQYDFSHQRLPRDLNMIFLHFMEKHFHHENTKSSKHENYHLFFVFAFLRD